MSRGGSAFLQSLVVKVAERCNLNCSYCYMYNHEDQSWRRRPLFMDEATFDRLLTRIRDYCEAKPRRRMGITFHGGEPMLMGAERLGRYAARAREVLGERLSHLALQTNATLVDSAWLTVLQREDIHVGVSLDGPAAIHDAARVDHAGRGSHAAVIRGLGRLRDAGFNVGVLCVVNPAVSGLEVYEYFLSLGLRSIAFLLPDVTRDTRPLRYAGLGATPVAEYLIPVFDRWFDDDDPAVSIRLFRELLMLMLGGARQTDAFGGGPMGYLVIETDGAIQPLDTLRACEEGLIETGLNVHEHGFDDLILGPPLLFRLVKQGLPTPSACRGCPEVAVCGGGYVTHRYSRATKFDNPSAWCADILKLLAHIRRRVSQTCPTLLAPSSSSPTVSATAC
jgi:uncharacterized protein